MLTVTNLSAGYGKVEVLRDVSLKVPKGKIVSLIGSNGAGKTTLMRAVSGMLKPSQGSVRLGEREIAAMDAHRIAGFGMSHSPEGRRVFQDLSVRDNLLLGAFTRYTGRRPKGRIDDSVDEVMAIFPRLRERTSQLAGTLSGGEQQMLAIGRALMLQPDVLLLDEPSMGLAPILVEEVFTVIAKLRERSITMLLVEQFAARALEVSDLAYVLENGRITVSGTAKELQNDPKVHAAYLGGGTH